MTRSTDNVVASNADGIERAVRAWEAGDVVAIPTETVYGLAGPVANVESIRTIFRLKGRPTNHPLIVHAASVDQLATVADMSSARVVALANAFWPGPLSLLVPKLASLSDEVTGGRDTVVVRIPSHPVALALLQSFGQPVAAPSANRYGMVSPTTAEHVVADLGDEVAVIVDGGPCDVGVESTIVDTTSNVVSVLRVGAIGAAELAVVLGETVVMPSELQHDQEVSGTTTSHYAPRARVRLVEESDAAMFADDALRDSRKVGIVGPRVIDGLPLRVSVLEPLGDTSVSYARRLYDRLRVADDLKLDELLVIGPDTHDALGVAILDRLTRASAG